jgi:protein phosphatase 1L
MEYLMVILEILLQSTLLLFSMVSFHFDCHNSRCLHWKIKVEEGAGEAFAAVHEKFLKTIAATTYRHGFMDSSGTTATALLASNDTFVIASLGDSRAVLSTQYRMPDGSLEIKPLQLTKDHVASDPDERKMVEDRGGTIMQNNGIDRVNGTLAITRSIGDASLASMLSRIPHVVSMTKKEILKLCGVAADANRLPCFLILASDGLWDTVDNQEAVDLVADVVMEVSRDDSNWREAAGLQRAAEALTIEAYVRGSNDNIGVCIIAIE